MAWKQVHEKIYIYIESYNVENYSMWFSICAHVLRKVQKPVSNQIKINSPNKNHQFFLRFNL